MTNGVARNPDTDRRRRRDPQYLIDPVTGCWLWQWSLSTAGYGQFSLNSKQFLAHIVEYERKYGPVPEGLELDHVVCSNRQCINPDHVAPRTHAQNIQRSPLAKITMETAREIRSYKGTATYKVLGERFGLDAASISRIMNNQSWSEAPCHV